ncbi:MAG: hypothetical protein U0Y08_03750 [Bacteroidia bacterium]
MDENIKNLERKIEESELLKKELNYLNATRKAKLFWNITFFLGILIMSVVVGLLSFGKELDFSKLLHETTSLFEVIVTLVISFASGTITSFLNFGEKGKKEKVKLRELVKDTYLSKLDASILNPQTSTAKQ